MSAAGTVTGGTVYNLIVKELNMKNLSGTPAIDKARQFPNCPNPLSIKSIFGSWKTVQISCPNTQWNIAVRTNVKGENPFPRLETAGKNRSINTLVALKTSLNRGDIIKDEHLTHYQSKKLIGGGVFHDKSHLIGRSLKKALSVGTIVRARHLNPDWIITKNQLVTIEHQVGNIIINAQGVAQESGQRGQRIWVNNFNSGKKVLCWVENEKKVTTNAKIY
tara:strand:+ start:842 stop:1501 length:660 start_codon:yes stop_codon:yes gene_type:complete